MNISTADHKFFLLNKDKLTQPIQMQLSKKQKIFCQFFIHFQNVAQILKISKQNMTLITDVFQKLRVPKNVVT